MDDGLSRFREAADRENAERPVRRRYSPTLQREAVAYWHHRRGQEGMRAVAAWGCPAIGIPPGERREPDAIGRRRHRGGDPDDGGGPARRGT